MTTPDQSNSSTPDSSRSPARGKGTAADGPAGMKRGSLYASELAFTAFTQAVDTVHSALGADTPRHVAVSALLQAGADQASEVIKNLAAQHAADLTARLAALQERTAD